MVNTKAGVRKEVLSVSQIVAMGGAVLREAMSHRWGRGDSAVAGGGKFSNRATCIRGFQETRVQLPPILLAPPVLSLLQTPKQVSS